MTAIVLLAFLYPLKEKPTAHEESSTGEAFRQRKSTNHQRSTGHKDVRKGQAKGKDDYSLAQRAVAHQYTNTMSEALKDYNGAIRLAPQNAVWKWWRGIAYASKQDYSAAIRDFSEVIKLKPKITEAWSGRAKCYLAQKEYDKGIADCTEAIRLDPKCAEDLLQPRRGFRVPAELGQGD